jgi:Rod binding domain-containing protein
MIAATHTSTLSLRDAEQLAPERLADSAHVGEADKIALASKHFEAILVRQFLSEAQKPLLAPKGQMSGATSEIYRDMMVNSMADQISKSGALGLAKQFQAQFSVSSAKPHTGAEVRPTPVPQ